MSVCEKSVTDHDDVPQVEVIGDEMKTIPLDDHHNRIARICILSVDPRYTIDVVHGNTTSGLSAEKNEQQVTFYPHDAEKVLKELDPNIIVETVYLKPNVRQGIAAIRRLKHKIDVFVNLYDSADETGVKIVDYMQNNGIAFTGASVHFYDPTRIELKRLCRYYRLPTPKFALIGDLNSYNYESFEMLSKTLGGFPLFVKPEHGYDSVGIDEKSLIYNVIDLKERCSKIVDEFGGALVEKYIEGREFTVLVAGSKNNIHVFPPVECRFPVNKAFITFDDKWGSNYTDSHWYLLNPTEENEEQQLIYNLMSLARRLYEAFNGDGYARMDIRQDDKSKELFILDCNPNCSVFYKDSCSADSIIQLSGWQKTKLMKFLLEEALERQRHYHLHHPYQIKYSSRNGFAMYASRNLVEGDLVYSRENSSLKLITKQFAQQTFTASEMESFNAYAWPICDNVYVLWHEDSRQWQPVNHSCDPNVLINGLQCVARRSIAAGEELTIDYSTYVTNVPTFTCWCGTSVCRHEIKPNEYKEQWFQDRYGSNVSPYILMLIGIEKLKSNI